MVWVAAGSCRAKSGKAAAQGLFGGHDGPLAQPWLDMKVGEYREPKNSCVACHEISCVQLPLLIQNLPPGSPGKSAKSDCLAALTGKRNLWGNT